VGADGLGDRLQPVMFGRFKAHTRDVSDAVELPIAE
jgi:hypothetical protein